MKTTERIRLLAVFFTALLSLAFVACDKDDAEDELQGNRHDFFHSYCKLIESRDGKVRVEYPDFDLSRSYLFIPAEGGSFSFRISDEARQCLDDPLCEHYGQSVDKYRIRINGCLEVFWDCKYVPLTLEDIENNEEHTEGWKPNVLPDYSPVETPFGVFESDEDGFTIHVNPNETAKEKSIFMSLDGPHFGVLSPLVQIIQACKD